MTQREVCQMMMIIYVNIFYYFYYYHYYYYYYDYLCNVILSSCSCLLHTSFISNYCTKLVSELLPV